jgi:hypothetical protein
MKKARALLGTGGERKTKRRGEWPRGRGYSPRSAGWSAGGPESVFAASNPFNGKQAPL